MLAGEFQPSKLKEKLLNIPLRDYASLLRMYLRSQQQRMWLLALLLLGSNGLQLLSPQLIRYFIDAVQSTSSTQQLLWAASLFLLVVVAQRLVTIATTRSVKLWHGLPPTNYDVTSPPTCCVWICRFHNTHTPGELLERIDGDVDRLANFFSEFVLQILGGLLLTLGVLVILYLEDWRIGAVLSLFVLAYMIIHIWISNGAAPEWRKERHYSAVLSGFVEERVRVSTKFGRVGRLITPWRAFISCCVNANGKRCAPISSPIWHGRFPKTFMDWQQLPEWGLASISSNGDN